jgi:hypothetical protein
MPSHVKQRVTFRLEPDLVRALRRLPNQTAFVEAALREALGRLCPLCHGAGAVREVHLAVSDLKNLPGSRLDRSAAEQLRALVRLGRELLATALEIEAAEGAAELDFRLAREDQVLLAGRIPRHAGAVEIRN